MRTYEIFKAEARRLTSLTCDGCGAELWAAPGQPYRTFQIPNGPQSRPTQIDVCSSCLEEVREAAVNQLSLIKKRDGNH